MQVECAYRSLYAYINEAMHSLSRYYSYYGLLHQYNFSFYVRVHLFYQALYIHYIVMAVFVGA